jgi:hypothetical protein
MKTISLEDLERQPVARKQELGIVGVDFLPVNDAPGAPDPNGPLASHRRELSRARAQTAVQGQRRVMHRHVVPPAG